MKFANLYWNNALITESDTMSVNFGDIIQFMSLDYLYSRCRIDAKDIVKLQVGEVKDYRGEELILPLNWNIFDPGYMEGSRLAISPDIIPVFLGTTIESHVYREEYFNEYNISYLRRYEPIGCRDEHTMKTLHKHHIRAYLNGCMTAVFPKCRGG